MQLVRQVLVKWRTAQQIRWHLNALPARRNVRILYRILMRWQTEAHEKLDLVYSLDLLHHVDLHSRLQDAFLHWKCQIAVRWALKGFMVC